MTTHNIYIYITVIAAVYSLEGNVDCIHVAARALRHCPLCMRVKRHRWKSVAKTEDDRESSESDRCVFTKGSLVCL